MRSNDYVRTYDLLDPENFYADAAGPGSRKHGTIVVDGKECAATLQCVHCNSHFTHRKSRGDWICLKCGGVVCGSRYCVERCEPFEEKLDQYEKGLRMCL